MDISFSSDRPIKDASEDILGRSDFAKNLAKSILNWHDSESLVIGIYGAWGDGKSSVKNLILNHIHAEKKENLILDFNPWQWGSEEKISKAFFEEISSVLKKERKDHTKLIKGLRRYSGYLDLGSEVSSELVEKTQKTFIGFAALVSAGGLTNLGISFKWSSGISLLLLIGSQMTALISYILTLVRRYLELGKPEDETLSDQKKVIREMLQKNNEKIYVLIDDLDRLTKEEIRSVFKLVKANADFPGIVYILFFQRDIVENAVSETSVFDGREYLKKIIQVGFDLPKISKHQMKELLTKSFEECLEKNEFLSTFSVDRWEEVFDDGILGYFSNLRDVNRFLSTYKFQLNALIVNEFAEANFIDLIGLEVLRVFEPALYTKLPTLKELLTQTGRSERQLQNKERAEQISDSIPDSIFIRKKSAQKILVTLFPNVEWAWSSGIVDVSALDFVKNRINHPDKFELYFRFAVKELDFTKSEMTRFLENTNRLSLLRSQVETFKKEDRLKSFIDTLQNYKEVIPVVNMSNFLALMFEVGDQVTDEMDGFLDNPLLRVERIIHRSFIVRRMKGDKKVIFKDAVTRSNGVFLPLDMIFKEITRSGFEKYPDHFIFSENDKAELEDAYRRQIEKFKFTKNFSESRYLPTIIGQWKKICPEEAQAWIDNYVQRDELFASYLNRMIHKGFSSSGKKTKTSRRISIYWLETLGDPKMILSKIEKLKLESRFVERYPHLKEGLDSARVELEDPDAYKRFSFDDDDDDDL